MAQVTLELNEAIFMMGELYYKLRNHEEAIEKIMQQLNEKEITLSALVETNSDLRNQLSERMIEIEKLQAKKPRPKR